MSTKPIDYAALAKKHGALHSVHESEVDDSMPDYKDVPAFIKRGIDMSKVKQVVTSPITDEDKKSTAGVDPEDPYTVKVFADDLYGPPILNHELTHTFQDTRNKSLPKVASRTMLAGRAGYNYGGVEGLKAARIKGKTISDFNYEQQADMVKDYKWFHDQYLKKAAEGKITPQDEKKMYELQQAYHPFIKQLSEMPGMSEKLDMNPILELLGIQKPATINTHPEPPGLPAYNTPGLGILPADPLMGGKSQATPVSLHEVKRKAEELKSQFQKAGLSQ